MWGFEINRGIYQNILQPSGQAGSLTFNTSARKEGKIWEKLNFTLYTNGRISQKNMSYFTLALIVFSASVYHLT